MEKVIAKVNDEDVFDYSYEKWKGYENNNSLVGEGVAFRFQQYLFNKGMIDGYTSVSDVYANMSGARDGNRYDIHDNYIFDSDKNLEITFLYTVNGNLWAVLYDKANDSYFGEFELPII